MPERKGLAIYSPSKRGNKTIGIIVHKLDSHFIASALKGIGKVSAQCGYEVVITNSQERMVKEVENAQLLFDREVDGVIASLSADTKSLTHFDAFADKGIPVVFFDRVENAVHGDTVVIDNARCGFLATEHLIRQGCRRIAIVTSCLTRNVYGQRYQGYREALNDYSIPFTEDLLVVGGIDNAGGLDAADKIMNMKPMPDGLFITSDLVAATCMQVLKESGIRIPEDIAVVGFNNDPVGRLISPALTTIDYSGLEMGKTAAVSLLHHLAGRRSFSETRMSVLPSELIVRDSSLRREAPCEPSPACQEG